VNKKLIGVFLFAAFIRLYNISYFASYGTETAQHYFEIIRLSQGDIFINGPLTSHPWLRLGPVVYYLFFPIFYLTRFHPLTLFYTWVTMDIGMIILNYYIAKKVFNEKIALLSTIFLALSPLQLLTNRSPGFYNFVIPLSYILLFSIFKTVKNKSFPYWPIFLVIGLMINLHASSLFLIPFCIGLGLYLKKISKSSFFYSLIAFISPNIPFFISDYFHNFGMTKNLLLWLPYKLYNFFLGRTLGVNRIVVKDVTFQDIVNFFKTSIFPPSDSSFFGIIVILLIVSYFFIGKNSRFINIIYLWLISGVLALFIHKNPPIHYFVPIFILPIVLVSYNLEYLIRNKRTKTVILFMILYIILSNIFFIFSPKYLFSDRIKMPIDIRYRTQEKISRFIIRDAKGRKFSISKIGPLDNYVGGSKENYEYLLWWMGNKPVQKSSLHYTVVEDVNRMPNNIPVNAITRIDNLIIFSSLPHNP